MTFRTAQTPLYCIDLTWQPSVKVTSQLAHESGIHDIGILAVTAVNCRPACLLRTKQGSIDLREVSCIG